jgi:kinesin family protein C1
MSSTLLQTQETQGMIPRALAQVFAVTNELKSKGWEYTMEGQFLEIVCSF